MSKPAKLGTVWTATARIQRINPTTMQWETLAQCMDTPNVIADAVRGVIRRGTPVGDIWVKSDTNGRRMWLDRK